MIQYEPPSLILKHSRAAEPHLVNSFLDIVQSLYSHGIFKNILDIVSTKCSLGKLQFVVQDAKWFDIDAGTCLTMTSHLCEKNYVITIKKLASDVIMHEIGHMLEQELFQGVNIHRFISTLLYEIECAPIHMKSTVQSLFIEQVKAYPESQKVNELIARFFQFFAGANEVAYRSSIPARYRLADAISVFRGSLEVLDSLSGGWNNLIDPKIAAISNSYLANPSKERWSDKRIESSKLGTTTESRWKVRSNKADPFK